MWNKSKNNTHFKQHIMKEQSIAPSLVIVGAAFLGTINSISALLSDNINFFGKVFALIGSVGFAFLLIVGFVDLVKTEIKNYDIRKRHEKRK